MNISTRAIDGVTVATLKGRLDATAAPELQSSLEELLETGISRLVLDFGKVDFVASSGLHILLVIEKRMTAEGGSLRICALNRTVMEIFEISGFNTILHVHPTLESALDGFQDSVS